tara:strand:+ start:117 stop:476 length:360 start_codon:yes stop_codon:yes gene_type:complete
MEKVKDKLAEKTNERMDAMTDETTYVGKPKPSGPLEKMVEDLGAEITRLRAENIRLKADNAVGSRKIVDQNDEIARLQAEVSQLKAILKDVDANFSDEFYGQWLKILLKHTSPKEEPKA